MRVTINGYGLVEFKPTELYRFLDREDMTQLRGKVRIQRSDLDVRTTGGEDWIDYDFWYTLDQVVIDSTDDLNLMVGLKVVTGRLAEEYKGGATWDYGAGEVGVTDFLDEQIKETIASMKILNKNVPDELRMYSELLSTYSRLTDLQKRK